MPGSSITSKHREIFQKTFRQLPFNILWKWENETMINQPENVFISKWVPQRAVLGTYIIYYDLYKQV